MKLESLVDVYKRQLYNNVIYCEGTRDGVFVEVAMQHNDSYTENIYTFVNNVNTPEGCLLYTSRCV